MLVPPATILSATSASTVVVTPRQAVLTARPSSAAKSTRRSPQRAIDDPAGRLPSAAPSPAAASTTEVVPSESPESFRYSGSTGMRSATPIVPAMTGR